MSNHRGQFLAHKIPGESSKCIVSFSATWLTANKAKGQQKANNLFKVWQILIEKLIPEKINR